MKRGGEDSSTNFFVYFCLLVPPESGPEIRVMSLLY